MSAKLEEWEQEEVTNLINNILARHEVGKIPSDAECRINPANGFDNWGMTDEWECDKCGGLINTDYITDIEYKFCPYCGRKVIE